MIIIVIAIVTVLFVIGYLIFNHKKKISITKMDATEEIMLIRTKLFEYKSNYIDGKTIDNQTATPLDNIAYFMTTIYPTLLDSQKLACNRHLFIYSSNLLDLLGQILKTPVPNDPKETDAYYKMQAERMSHLYRQLMTDTYVNEIQAHQDEFNNLSTYEYMAMQKSVEVWKLETEYQLNEQIDKGGTQIK